MIAMLRITPANTAAGIDPSPCFATDAEVALAARLRRQLEERYFGTSATASPDSERSDNIH
jgi:hypothetical protein